MKARKVVVTLEMVTDLTLAELKNYYKSDSEEITKVTVVVQK